MICTTWNTWKAKQKTRTHARKEYRKKTTGEYTGLQKRKLPLIKVKQTKNLLLRFILVLTFHRHRTRHVTSSKFIMVFGLACKSGQNLILNLIYSLSNFALLYSWIVLLPKSSWCINKEMFLKLVAITVKTP